MNLSYEVLNILVFLIPGFLSSIIYNSVVSRKERDNFVKIIEALIYSLIAYIIAALIYNKSPFIFHAIEEGNSKQFYLNYQTDTLIAVLVTSTFLPLVLGYFNNNNLISKILSKLKISKKTSRESTWLDVFSDVDKYVIVNLKDGRRIYGWPSYYSSTPEEGMLYLRDPAWISEANEYIDLDLDGLFLVERNNIDYIEMLNYPQTKRKETLWKRLFTRIQVLKPTRQKAEEK